MEHCNWIPSDDELETFGPLTFDPETGLPGGTESPSIDDDEDEMPPSQGG